MKTTQIQFQDSASLGESAHIEKALNAIPGVKAVRVESEAHRVTVEHESVDEQKLADAIRATGIAAEIIPDQAEVLSPPVPRMDAAI